MSKRKHGNLDPALEVELDRFVDQLIVACRVMVSEGWDDFEIDAMCESAILHKGREMMEAFREAHLETLRAEGVDELGVEGVRVKANELIERDLAAIEAGQSRGREVLH
jgi:hypothetical protein